MKRCPLIPTLEPQDVHNQELVAQTHPKDWVNPQALGRYDLVVVGAGTAGLSAAGAGAAVGGKVALVEQAFLGGDCLVTGCVPSKGLIRAARLAHDCMHAADFGIHASETRIDFQQVMQRMRRLRAQISHNDAVKHMQDAGVDVFFGPARFSELDTLEVGGQRLRFRKAVIATGGRPYVPAIPGLDAAGYLTSETLFQLTELPPRLAVIGGGPIGCEMAQTFQRLGAEVTLIHSAGHFLNREDPDAAAIVQSAFEREGVRLLLNTRVLSVEIANHSRVLQVESDGVQSKYEVDAILVSAGRCPSVQDLALEKAAVKFSDLGIDINDRMQTSNPRIYAAGDVCSRYQFTHTANVMGRSAVVNALLFGRNRHSAMNVPWCTYTDPEIAHVGLYARQVEAQGIAVETLNVPFAENDRALLDGQAEGFVRVHLKQGSDKILGATIVAAHAGDLITYFTLAMNQGRGLSSLANAIYPYPTQAEAIKRLAGTYSQRRLTPGIKGLLKTIVRRG